MSKWNEMASRTFAPTCTPLGKLPATGLLIPASGLPGVQGAGTTWVPSQALTIANKKSPKSPWKLVGSILRRTTMLFLPCSFSSYKR